METRTVLFVDDEENILRSLERIFVNEPYRTLYADSGKTALEILDLKQVHIIITDMKMPEMNGIELLKIVRDNYPRIIRLILSGYSDRDLLLAAINQGELFRYITKPWKCNEELKTIVRQSIEFYELHSEREFMMDFIEKIAEKTGPEQIDLRFIVEMMVSARDKHLYEWEKNVIQCP